MSVVKINAITPAEGMEEELEARFGARAGEVEHMEGFEGFQLLRPVRGETRYYVYTKWRSEEDFERWVNSEEFRRGHAKADGERQVATHAQLLSFEVVAWDGEAEPQDAATQHASIA